MNLPLEVTVTFSLNNFSVHRLPRLKEEVEMWVSDLASFLGSKLVSPEISDIEVKEVKIKP